MPAPFLLFVLFLVLKVSGVIAWSWLWVTAPLWLPFLAFALVGSMVFVLAVIAAIAAAMVQK